MNQADEKKEYTMTDLFYILFGVVFFAGLITILFGIDDVRNDYDIRYLMAGLPLLGFSPIFLFFGKVIKLLDDINQK